MKNSIAKNFDSVNFFMKVKNEISKKMEGKTFTEQKKILKDLKFGKTKIVLTK